MGNYENHEKRGIPLENNENHEIIRVPQGYHETNKNHENIKTPWENHENNKIIRIPLENLKTMICSEFIREL